MVIESPIRQRRLRAGLSIREIAEFAGLNRGQVSLFEQGRYLPTPDQLGRYMEVLGDYESLASRRGVAPYLTDDERALRAKARTLVTAALRKGTLRRGTCEVCGSEVTVAHHRWGYEDPLRVAWLCGPHHGSEHYDMNADRHGAANDARRADFSERAAVVRAKYRGGAA